MRNLARVVFALTVLTALWMGAPAQAAPTTLSHRLWALPQLPPASELAVLQAAGFTEIVVSVGRVELSGGRVRFSLMPLPEAGRLTGWKATALVWVVGSGKAAGDAAAFATQLTPVLGTLKGGGGVLLCATSWAEGIPVFASAVAAKLGRTVDLAMPAATLAAHLEKGGWKGVRPVAVGLGNPGSLGFPNATFQDDLAAIDALAGALCPYRVAIPVASRVTPPPGPAGASLAVVVLGRAATYKPGARGDVLQLDKPLDWGGTLLKAGQQIELDLTDTTRYNRDLAAVLRPARPGFEGVDTIGIPAPEPTIGMSRQAFLDYLGGGGPNPQPRIEASWSGATVRINLLNPTPHASALATTGNWIEIDLIEARVADVALGEFSGVEYGKLDDRGVFKRTGAGDAKVLRFYAMFLPPGGRVSGGMVTFSSRPKGVKVRWNVRLGDGNDVTGPSQQL